MKGSVALIFIAISLLIKYQQVEARFTSPVCKTQEATDTLLECRTNFLQLAGHNFTDDCEDGVVQTFMQCITEIEGCNNVSAFVEKAFYDYYGCMDTSITVYKRSWVRRFVCNLVCRFSCGYVCTYTGPFGPVCRYVCRRVCRNVCEWVWRWVADRIGRDIPMIAPEDSDDLTQEEIEYIEGTRNLCSDCVCSVDVQNPPIEKQLESLSPQPSSSLTIFAHFHLFLILSLAAVTAM